VSGPRKVVLYTLLSIDGVAEDPDRWFFDVDDGLLANLAEVIGRQDAVLLGRRMYDEWARFWPGSDMEPFAAFINGTAKHVFTSAEPPPSPWAGSTFVAGPAAEYVAALKRRPGRDIGIHGSISLAQSLLRAELVDELRLVIAPTVAGGGRRLFEDGVALQRFELIDSDRTPEGAVLLGYGRRP
jgi:dihydrofolate reductase